MDFRDDAKLDPSQVEDTGGGGGGFRGGPIAIGGGITGLIALIVTLVLNNLGGGDTTSPQPTTNLAGQCRSGKDADQSEKCRVVGVVNSIQDYWKGVVPDYRAARTTLYSGSVSTACGTASSDVGPFYCPGDRKVYLDLSFFDDLQSRFGAKGGPFAQAYVIAHEYGHHVQNLTGALQGGGSVKTELQADCYAGVWTKNATETGFYSQPFTQADIAEALDAAAAVGDDRIQQRTQGRVDPDSFTHGTSAQRVAAFQRGHKSGKPTACAQSDLP
ncbi:neutral zinc metallopeptidase [Nonomuraea sp. NBC_01738]|uniref:KPN_02809 family neutral zinc metallopeptidase n=1 Tax=Nonomuraea sp. NBC_01738 TaxID=2976003 RepID=UPI002E113CF5|nr:neutral zinc metallopeptidase [Nonomuraea sp. NBC_01738]